MSTIWKKGACHDYFLAHKLSLNNVQTNKKRSRRGILGCARYVVKVLLYDIVCLAIKLASTEAK